MIMMMMMRMIVIMVMIMIINVSNNNYINLICNIGFRYGPCSGVKDVHIHIM